MCMNIECSKKGHCYRYLAVPSPHCQSYAAFTEPCDSYWPVGDASGPVLSLKEAERDG